MNEAMIGYHVRQLPDRKVVIYQVPFPTMAFLRSMFVTSACAAFDAKTVLDVGGGNGEVSKFIPAWARVTVLDRNPSVKPLLDKNGVQEFVVGDFWDAEKLLSGRTFDVVLLAEVIEHMPTFVDAVKLLKHLTKFSSNIVLTTPCERDWDAGTHPFTNPDHKIYWTDVDLLMVFELAGLNVLHFDRVRANGMSYYLVALSTDSKTEFKLFPMIGVEVMG